MEITVSAASSRACAVADAGRAGGRCAPVESGPVELGVAAALWARTPGLSPPGPSGGRDALTRGKTVVRSERSGYGELCPVAGHHFRGV